MQILKWCRSVMRQYWTKSLCSSTCAIQTNSLSHNPLLRFTVIRWFCQWNKGSCSDRSLPQGTTQARKAAKHWLKRCNVSLESVFCNKITKQNFCYLNWITIVSVYNSFHEILFLPHCWWGHKWEGRTTAGMLIQAHSKVYTPAWWRKTQQYLPRV